MRDAFGTYYSLTFVFVAIIILTSLIAYFVNYNKAFVVKNKLVTTFKVYDNDPNRVDCNVDSGNDCIREEIKEYAKKVGYTSSKEYMQPLLNEYMTSYEGAGYKCVTDVGWCYKIFCETQDSDTGELVTKYNDSCKDTDINVNGLAKRYAKVVTFVSIDIPVFNKIFSGISLFRVTGSSSPTVTLAGNK